MKDLYYMDYNIVHGNATELKEHATDIIYAIDMK